MSVNYQSNDLHVIGEIVVKRREKDKIAYENDFQCHATFY